MIKHILISERTDLEFENVVVLNPKYYNAAVKMFNLHDSIAVDIETTGLNCWKDDILLLALYNPNLEFVLIIDAVTVDITIFKDLIESKLVLAHNVQFEASFLSIAGIEIKRCYDTMVAEDKLTQGSIESTSLINTLKRRNLHVPEGMIKDTIQDFISGAFYLEEKHVIYNASDVLSLYALKKVQEENIKVFKLGFFINSIHNPLALILTKIKLEGFIHDSDKWLANAAKLEEKCNDYIQELNEQVMPIVNWQKINSDYAAAEEKKSKGIERNTERIKKLKANIERYRLANKTHLKSYIKAVETLEKAKILLTEYNILSFSNYMGINWSSSKQVLETFTQLGLTPLPKSKSATTHKIQPSISKAAREAWLLENKSSDFTGLMKTFHELKNQLHLVKSFGVNWVEKYINPVTGKVHTNFRQNAATGRLTSGNADEGLFNSQQIPGLNDFRTCFGVEEDYMVGTLDYSGAELCFMAALAEDEVLVELSKRDMHSYFANKGWEAIYENRGLRMVGHQVISKKQNKDQRTAYKPMMFGVVYGLMPKKAAEILNVSVKEGALAIRTITREIPKTIKFVEQASAEALARGYVVHNNRTNSRRWFSDVLAANALDRELPFMIRTTVESTARNTKIQGSQADMVMEAIVAVYRWINIYKIDACILGTVHDEIILKYHKSIDSWFPARAKILMEKVAHNYMKGFLELKADCDTGLTWIKE